MTSCLKGHVALSVECSHPKLAMKNFLLNNLSKKMMKEKQLTK